MFIKINHQTSSGGRQRKIIISIIFMNYELGELNILNKLKQKSNKSGLMEKKHYAYK